MTNGGPDDTGERKEPVPGAVSYVDQPSPETKVEQKRPDVWTVVMGIVGGALLGTGITLAILGITGVFEEPPPPTAPTIPPPPTLTIPEPSTAPLPAVDPGVTGDVAERAIPSIVTVESSSFLGQTGGSGVVYGTDGYLITNHHVIDGASSVAVVFFDGARYPAEVIGSDALTDIAVLRVDRPDLSPIDVGTSAHLRIGEMAVAVGNPLALLGGPSVTSGIVSALGRTLELDGGTTLFGLVQTDAPITRGSSGGALLDGSARLIGITTAIAVSDVGAEGLGFAIPIDMVIGIANDLIEMGEVRHALLGVEGTTALAEEAGAQYPAGVLVGEILPDSAYEQGGGHVNDVIVSLDDVAIRTLDELLTALRMRRADQQVVIGVIRADADLEIDVTLGRLDV